jgi:hypothetical protein
MNSRKLTAVLTLALFLGAFISLAGCAKTGIQRSAKAGTSMQSVENDIVKMIEQVDATGASLRDLVEPGQSDVKKAFKEYSSNVNKMDGMEKRFLEHSDKMSEQGKEYFQEWKTTETNYNNPRIQVLSEQRRADQSAVFVRIAEASVGVKGAFKSYMSDIREIQLYLSNDLTSKGVEAITPVADKSVLDGNALKDAIRPVLYAIGQARAELVQGGN